MKNYNVYLDTSDKDKFINTKKNLCPDYDEDCISMSLQKANWCFMGCQGHQCNPDSSLGTAKGVCPIIHNCN